MKTPAGTTHTTHFTDRIFTQHYKVEKVSCFKINYTKVYFWCVYLNEWRRSYLSAGDLKLIGEE